MGGGLSWLRNHVQYFIEGVLGEQYQEIWEKSPNSSRPSKISPDPDFWFDMYAYDALRIVDQKIDYHAYVDCVPYFVSIIPFVTKLKVRKNNNLFLLLENAEKLAVSGEGSELSLEFAKELLSHEEEIRANWAVNAHLDEDE